MRRICSYLNDEFCDAMLSPGAIDSSYESEVIKRDSNIGIVKNNKDKWKSVISIEEGEYIDSIVNEKYVEAILNKPFTTVRVISSILWQLIWIYKNKLGLVGLISFSKFKL